jgi:hypothetical protein
MMSQWPCEARKNLFTPRIIHIPADESFIHDTHYWELCKIASRYYETKFNGYALCFAITRRKNPEDSVTRRHSLEESVTQRHDLE